MHDSLLIQNISKAIKEICSKSNLRSISSIEISVDYDSHITNENLLKHLKELNGETIKDSTNVKVNYENMENLTAIITKLEGEKNI